MKKFIYTLMLVVSWTFCFSQDVVTKKNGDEIKTKLIEITTDQVKYKKFENLEGPTYSILKSELFMIKYENGTKDVFTDNENKKSEAETGKVYFIRGKGHNGSATSFKAFMDDSLVCKLNNKSYSIHIVKAGEHKFTVQFAGTVAKERAEAIKINVEAGKTYYIQMIIQPGFAVNNLYCQEVTENSAKTVLLNLKEDTNCN